MSTEEQTEPQTRDLVIKLTPALASLLEKARVEFEVRTGDRLDDQELGAMLIGRACESILVLRGEDVRPIGAMTVAELAELLGMTDLEAAKRNATAERDRRAEMFKVATEQLAHVQGVARICNIVYLRTPETVDRMAFEAKAAIGSGPGRFVVAMMAVADQTGEIEKDIGKNNVH